MAVEQRMAPIFYGWWVVLGSVLLRLASAPGHSFGINAFVEHFVADLDLERTLISSMWLVASCTRTIAHTISRALTCAHESSSADTVEVV